ncbi:hypothetical protein [Polyangium mundeleinium]|uniref:Uncharacterized protein n=1 Tax=Polyangium mundeleinium TaxID=2995306 RepID=A0ABT5EID0_9BACT|nr:hypothetical protein [Polyangium mundeleinium]MDC0741142.1 hypothetical protein [Polyangium mundeleinium]
MVGERQAGQGSTTEQGADRGPLAALGGVDPNEVLTMVSDVARANPHAALAGAVAVGFLLGGGLTPRLLGAAALFTARRYFRATVEETLAGLEHGLAERMGNAGAR